MIKFIFKIGEETVDLVTVHNPVLKKSFEGLKTSLEKHIGTLTCTAHKRGPVVTLHNDGSEAVISGLGSCCEELNQRAKDILKERGYNVEQWTSVTTTNHSYL